MKKKESHYNKMAFLSSLLDIKCMWFSSHSEFHFIKNYIQCFSAISWNSKVFKLYCLSSLNPHFNKPFKWHCWIMSNYEDDQSEDGELARSPVQDEMDFRWDKCFRLAACIPILLVVATYWISGFSSRIVLVITSNVTIYFCLENPHLSFWCLKLVKFLLLPLPL